MQDLAIPARDGFALAAKLYRPNASSASNGAAVLLQAAAGVRQEYYAKFAAYLAERGFTVLTFDYRGIGRSRPADLRGFAARMRDWAVLDAAGALDFLEREVQGARLLAVGHSFGGQCFGIVPDNHRYAAALVVSSQSGYWRHWAGRGRAGMWVLTHALLPGLSRALGYFPARRLGQGEDLPAGVATEWAQWCRHPEYLVGSLDAKADYARFKVPLRAVWVDDDGYAPLAAVRALLALYPAADAELHEVRAQQIDNGPIGHFGFFRERFRATLWKDAADWLAQHK